MRCGKKKKKSLETRVSNSAQLPLTEAIHVCLYSVPVGSGVVASYPWLLVGGEKKSLVSVHVRNYPLLNTCLGKSGRGTHNTYPRDLIV